MGVNFLILEINYGFAFRSHPELSGGDNALTVEDARELAEICRKAGIRLIPMFNSWGTNRGRGQRRHYWPSIPSSTSRPRSPRTIPGSIAGAGARFTLMSTRSSSP